MRHGEVGSLDRTSRGRTSPSIKVSSNAIQHNTRSLTFVKLLESNIQSCIYRKLLYPVLELHVLAIDNLDPRSGNWALCINLLQASPMQL